MANKRSSQRSRGPGQFRTEVSSFLADLDELAEQLAPPAPSIANRPAVNGKAAVVVDHMVSPPPAAPEEAPATVEAQEHPELEFQVEAPSDPATASEAELDAGSGADALVAPPVHAIGEDDAEDSSRAETEVQPVFEGASEAQESPPVDAGWPLTLVPHDRGDRVEVVADLDPEPPHRGAVQPEASAPAAAEPPAELDYKLEPDVEPSPAPAHDHEADVLHLHWPEPETATAPTAPGAAEREAGTTAGAGHELDRGSSGASMEPASEAGADHGSWSRSEVAADARTDSQPQDSGIDALTPPGAVSLLEGAAAISKDDEEGDGTDPAATAEPQPPGSPSELSPGSNWRLTQAGRLSVAPRDDPGDDALADSRSPAWRERPAIGTASGRRQASEPSPGPGSHLQVVPSGPAGQTEPLSSPASEAVQPSAAAAGRVTTLAPHAGRPWSLAAAAESLPPLAPPPARPTAASYQESGGSLSSSQSRPARGLSPWVYIGLIALIGGVLIVLLVAGLHHRQG